MSAPAQKSLFARLFSMEGLLLLAGIALLVAGCLTGSVIALFWGGMAIAGQIALHFVRKKDWQAHWAAMEGNRPPDRSDESADR